MLIILWCLKTLKEEERVGDWRGGMTLVLMASR
jgi:hypothetical protein